VAGGAGTTPSNPPFARGGKTRDEIGRKPQLAEALVFISPAGATPRNGSGLVDFNPSGASKLGQRFAHLLLTSGIAVMHLFND
jgi:hypothetical protein